MHRASRFASSSAGLDLGVLRRRQRRMFGLSLTIALLLHLGVVSLNPFQQQTLKPPRPLMTRFVKREPRLTKALELRKVPRFERRMLRRHVRPMAARLDQIQATAAFSTRHIIARSTRATGMPLRVDLPELAVEAEPQMRWDVDLGVRPHAENRIDMALEMLDVDAMDTGRYQALVVQDANDKQALKGFVNLARVVSASYVATTETNVVDGGLNTQEIDILRDMVNEWTGLQADFSGSLTFDDPRLLEVPIILPQGVPNENEMRNLAQYLLAGGFVMAEQFDFDGFWAEALVKYGGLVEGRDFYTQRLPADHPIFHAFFDLGDGVALGSARFDEPYYWNVVKGLFVKGRLVAIPRANAGIGGYFGYASGRDSTRILQFAVNTVIYALTQEGSMTQRLMQMVN
ncbi:MAG TPA: DUF4159 domain-containing protein [Candidatus Latescibacteria bacterium]|jgi:hypothetical protein|nr:DUF4159 domain-containing protein [Candidatus Latescibacterota bacterium]HJP31293.1 DUF4159 domain-containing protein [Candidatus Latescibacterota bacterium]|tara:strand:- start:1057 stop:2262 length:1206 start_codon:yes stop_codon:yes gene_type:complete